MDNRGLRKVALRRQGRAHGPITRLISPDDLGERLKPFIFLDYFNAEIQPGFGFPMHPHSGIATLTWQPGCDVQYQDTTGQSGLLKAGGLEWMNAGGGAWHQGMLMGSGLATGFQLWVPMPPVIEDGPSKGQYVPPQEVPVVSIDHGTVKVLLGQWTPADGGPPACSPIDSHQDMNYFVVRLGAGATWVYSPPADHDVAWLFVFDGTAQVQGKPSSGQILVFSEEQGEIAIGSQESGVSVLLGSARRHAHPLVLGSSSVHTNRQSLKDSTDRIRELGNTFRR
jgi:redox-sensitive bicupin YhaK (pirin superfamily)